MNKLSVVSFFVASALMGCGGGGGTDGGGDGLAYTGATTPAAITANNAATIAEAAAEAVQQAVLSEEGVAASPFGVVVTDAASVLAIRSKAGEIGVSILKQALASQYPVGIVLTSAQLNAEFGEALFCGGSINISDAYYNAMVNEALAGQGTVTLNNICIDMSANGAAGQYVIDGSMAISYNLSQGFENVTYTNFTVTESGAILATVNGAENCTFTYDSVDDMYSNYLCTFTSYYRGGDGNVYQMQVASLFGDSTNGWDVDATFYHPSYGSVAMVASGLKFGCDNGHPSAGAIDIDGASGTSIAVEFIDCSTYSGSHDAGSSAVSFSGW